MTLPPASAQPTPMPERQRVDVVVHTHWDREWYMDRETTLARLEVVMGRVLADLDAGRLQQFLFDGQTVALEDLASQAPAALMQGLKAHAQAGRLVLGPWYVASDEFLVSGESLLRNLALGLEQARAWGGGGQSLGYLPDTFGHAAQMPQILRQFGIGHAVVWRGVEARHDFFDWQALDGSSVATVYLSEGYYLHPLHGPDWMNQTMGLLHKLLARRDPLLGGPLLLTHGGDHLAPHPQLAARLQEFNQAQDQFDLRQACLLDHAKALDARAGQRPALRGELRHNRAAFVLPDVLSTRRYLKRLHQAAEDRLLGHIEPLMAQTSAGASEQAHLRRAWQVLLQQQAHDSICGCSRDEVHEEMVLRFAQLHRSLDALEQRLMHHAGLVEWDRHGTSVREAAVFDDDSRFTAFNPLPWSRHAWFEAQLFLKGPARSDWGVVDAQGQAVPMVVLATEPAFELISPLDEFPERIDGHRYTVAVQLTLQGLGATALRVVAAPCTAPMAATPRGPVQMGNAAWQVELDAQGQLLLTDRRHRPALARPLRLMMQADAGDTYNHSPLPAGATLLNPAWQVLGQRSDATVQELHLGLEWRVPQRLDEQRLQPSDHTVVCSGELRLRLLGDEPQLHLKLRWDNQAQDQRTRLVLGAVPTETPHTWRDTAFAWTPHPVVLASVPEPIGRGEAPVSVQPSLSAIAAGPWWVAHRALNEHELIPDPCVNTQPGHGRGLALAMTLVRSVGWMSRRDLRTRGVGAGPDLPTPQAQCLGVDHFDWVLVAHSAHAPAHALLQEAQAFRRPVRVLRGHAQHWGDTLNLPDTPLQLSACRRLEGGQMELRLWNPSQAAVELPLPRGAWARVYADGRAWPSVPTPGQGQAPDVGLSMELHTVAPHQLLTLRSTSMGGQV